MTNVADAAMDAWHALFRGAQDSAARVQRAMGLGHSIVDGEGTGQLDVAPRDAAWVELVSADTKTRYGRGHLYLWHVKTEDDLMRAELRSFAPHEGGEAPAKGDCLAVRPEQEMELYPVVVAEYGPGSENIVALIWPDTELPASLREVGGN